MADRAVTSASFVFGGMDRCRGLKVCLADGAGYRCFGMGRMDRGWQLRCEVRMPIEKPPRAFLRKFYEDYLTHSAPALRFLIVSVGTDRVVLGTDWRAATRIDWPVTWVLSLKSLTQEEKENSSCGRTWSSCRGFKNPLSLWERAGVRGVAA